MPDQARTEDALLKPKQAAAFLGICEKELRKLVHSGKLKYVLFGARKRLYDPADLLVCREAHKKQAIECPSTDRKTRRTTTSTSSSKVYDITVRLAQRNAKRRKR